MARRKLVRRPYGTSEAGSGGGDNSGSGGGDNSGSGGGGGGGVDGKTVASDDGSSDMSDGDVLTRRCGTSTASIKTPPPLRLRLCSIGGCCGVGDGLRAVPSTASAVCSRRAAAGASGVVGCSRRLRWTSSRSASLSSSGATTGAAARLLFGDRGSASGWLLLARRLPSCGETSAMRSKNVAGRSAGGLGGEFSLSAPPPPPPLETRCLGERNGDRGVLRLGVDKDVEPVMIKSSDVGMMGENTIPRWTDAVFDGREGEPHVSSAAFGVDMSFFVGVRKGLESGDDVSVVSDPSSSLSVAARVDDELQENAGSSVGTLSTVSTMGAWGLSATFTSLPHALRQVVTGEGHPSFGTGTSA